MKVPNVYIHVPFCRSKCAYCAFYSTTTVEGIDAYLSELEAQLAASNFAEPVRTLYLGGGTPTLLPIPQLEQLFRLLRNWIPLTADAEISIESNPETLTADKMALVETFCTRISCGIQSFDPDLRKILGRDVSQEAIERVKTLWERTSIPERNIDLIYGIAGQTPMMWEQEVATALSFGITHLSCYALTYEENTRLLRERPVDFDEEEADAIAEEIWKKTPALLTAHKMLRYEISNYACPGSECKHNSSIWRGESYAGFGPGAAGFDGINRYSNIEDLSKWLQGAPLIWDVVKPETRYGEIFGVGLRRTAGWQKEEFLKLPLQKLFPCSWETMLQRATAVGEIYPGTLDIQDSTVKATELGLSFWNTIASELL